MKNAFTSYKASCLVLLTYFLFLNVVNAQNGNIAKKKSISNIKTKGIIPSSPTPLNELDLYKLLYANARDANKDLSQILQWTIGIVIVFIALVLGSQYLFNIRLNEEKIKKIKAELDTEYEKLKADLINDKNEAINLIKEENKKLYEQNLLETKERYDKQETRFEGEIKRVEMELEIRSDEIVGDNYFAKEDYSNALKCYLNTNTLRLYKDMHYMPQEFTVRKITDCLTKMDYLWEIQAKPIVKFLESVKETRKLNFLQKEISELENTYEKKPIKKLSDLLAPIRDLDLPYIFSRTLKVPKSKGDIDK